MCQQHHIPTMRLCFFDMRPWSDREAREAYTACTFLPRQFRHVNGEQPHRPRQLSYSLQRES